MEKGQKRKRETSEEEPTLTLPPGLRHSASFLTPDESKKLVEWIELQTWSTTLARKTQHYGYEYSYAKKSVAPKYLGPLPKEFDFILERAKEQCLISETMTQLIINDYEVGQGISKHVDSPHFGNEIMSVSLLSDCIMTFKKGEEKIDVLLERNSVVVMTGESRSKWTHEISKNKTYLWKGKKCQRGHRISLTFRCLAHDK